MEEPTVAQEIEASSWRWHHKLAGVIGAICLPAGVAELAAGRQEGVPLMFLGAIATGHSLGGSRVAGWLGADS